MRTPVLKTEAEQDSRTVVEWHTLEEVIRLIVEPKHTTTQRMFLQARDLAALKEFTQRMQNGTSNGGTKTCLP